MDASTTFHLLLNGGFTLGIEGDKLTVRPTSRLTDALRQAIRAHKSELISMLRRPSWRWLVEHPDGTVTDHTISPPDTLAQMRAAYPDAVKFEPLYFDARPLAQLGRIAA